MVHVTRKEIEKAFRNHTSAVEAVRNLESRTNKMVLFYAVECGLKALYMRENKLNKTSAGGGNSNKKVIDFKHDLNGLSKQLNINIIVPKAESVDSSQIEIKELHAAWRYGKILKIDNEVKCVRQLKALLNQLKRKL